MSDRPFSVVALSLGLFLMTLVAPGRAVPADCAPLYQDAAWTISTCPDDPSVPATMDVWLDGVRQGETAARLEVAHVTGDGSSRPTVAVLYGSGYVRLKQNGDPTPPIPFGTSAVLGPAYWAGGTYYHNPTLDKVHIDTDWLPDGPLRLTVSGTNADLEVGYEITLPPPSDELTRWHVRQHYTATAAISLDGDRLANHEGFKLVQLSSMFINQSGPCDGGDGGCPASGSKDHRGSRAAHSGEGSSAHSGSAPLVRRDSSAGVLAVR